ncbi:MAG: PKD domain-containing protein [Opitutaceae bacterium]
MKQFRSLLVGALAAGAAVGAPALVKPERTYPVFQFPADQIPRVDGDASDWAVVPDSYVIGTDQLVDDKKRHTAPDPADLDVRVRVAWVKGLNRLYFLYEAYDNYWDYTLPDIHNDTFEVVVDGDASGGPLIDKAEPRFWTPARVGESAATPDDRITGPAAHWAVHGVHAQNYHIFTPSIGKDWCMAWGAPTWIKQLPWSNAASRFDGRPGQPGHLVLEFWITPFDYAGPEGPARAVESVLTEGKIIGLAWAVIDYDDVASKNSHAFWNLSTQHTMYGDASELCAFRLLPLEPALAPQFAAAWAWTLVDASRRLVVFSDRSAGEITAWKWDFGDGATSTDQHPQHVYAASGSYSVVLEVTGPSGSSRLAKVQEVQLP